MVFTIKNAGNWIAINTELEGYRSVFLTLYHVMWQLQQSYITYIPKARYFMKLLYKNNVLSLIFRFELGISFTLNFK